MEISDIAILEKQEIILKKIEKISNEILKIQKNQEELLKKYHFLLNNLKKEEKNIYKIVNQLLLKDLLENHKDIMSEILKNHSSPEKLLEENSDMLFVEGGLYIPSFFNEEREVFDLYVNKYQTAQDSWEKYMGENPSRFRDGRRPVEKITWIQALEFCNKMSEEYGFQPVYKIENNKLIKIIYKNGEEVYPDLADFSKTNGYRLPTEIEWEWFAKGGKVAIQNNTFNTIYSRSQNIEEVAWYVNNSENQTYVVGTKNKMN